MPTIEELHGDDDIVLENGDVAGSDNAGEAGDGKEGQGEFEPSGDPRNSEGQGESGEEDNEGEGDNGDPVDPDLESSDPRTNPIEEGEITNGIESFLAEFNIAGGMVQIEDEDGNPVEKNFVDLTEEEKFNVLMSLSDMKAQSIESKYDLQNDEIKILNDARKNDMSMEDYMEKLAQERVDQLLALNETSAEVNYKDMSDDAIFMKFLKDSDPDATEEDIADELSNAKNGRLFTKNVERIRENYINQQEEEAKEAARVEQENYQKELEEERSTIVQNVVEIDTIADWQISDDDKNATLEKILEVNEYGDPVFMQEVFSDPKSLFKAAWLYYNAEGKFDEMANYFKKEQTKAYNKGFSAARNGMPTNPISVSNGSNVKKDNKTDVIPKKGNSYMSLEDLDED